MVNTFWTAFATSTLAAFITSLGIFTIRRFTAWGQRNTSYFMCFAAGVLISASFLHIIPKSFTMTAQAPVWLLVQKKVQYGCPGRWRAGCGCHRDVQSSMAQGLHNFKGNRSCNRWRCYQWKPNKKNGRARTVATRLKINLSAISVLTVG
jgi:hypothetical protein